MNWKQSKTLNLIFWYEQVQAKSLKMVKDFNLKIFQEKYQNVGKPDQNDCNDLKMILNVQKIELDHFYRPIFAVLCWSIFLKSISQITDKFECTEGKFRCT